jgi:aryl-alcohol dehydrogenase-like predicted oxidoreductase
MEETLGAFARLHRAGKVRYFGASNFETGRLDEARRLSVRFSWPAYVCVQMRHTYLHCNPRVPLEFSAQMAATPEMLDYCQSQNVRLLAYSPLLGGAYCRSDRPLPEAYCGTENERRLQRLQAMAQECRATVNQVVLAWLMQRCPASIPVVAASSLAQIQENLGALGLQVDTFDKSTCRGGMANLKLPR